MGRQLGIMRAGLALDVPICGISEERLIPTLTARKDRVVGKEIRLFRIGHEKARLRAELRCQRAGAGFHCAKDYKIWTGHTLFIRSMARAVRAERVDPDVARLLFNSGLGAFASQPAHPVYSAPRDPECH